MQTIPNPLKTDWQKKFLRLNCLHAPLQTAADEVEHFCNRWVLDIRERSMLILVGQPGCGKTHLLKSVERFCRGAQQLAHKKRSERAQDVRPEVPSVTYVYWPTVASDLAKGQDWPVDDCCRTDMLLWDDLGAENDPWKNIADRACQILSRREKKFTAITTNILPSQWEERFDSRIADRLLRNSVVVDLSDVPSYAMR